MGDTTGLMALPTVVTGMRVKSQVWVPIIFQMAVNIKENGWRIACMELAFSAGKIISNTSGNLRMIKNMDTESFSGQMVEFIMDNGFLENNMD